MNASISFVASNVRLRDFCRQDAGDHPASRYARFITA